MKALIEQLIALLKQYLATLPTSPENEVQKDVISENPYTVVDNILYLNGDPVRFEPTTKMSGKITGPRFLIQHYTANNTLEGTIRTFKNFSASSHLIIDRDGTVVQMVPFNRIAWHAGISRTVSKWGTKHSGLNKYSIGLEFVNFGYYGKHVNNPSEDVGKWYRLQHKDETSKKLWQPYTPEQIEAAELINAALMEAYQIPVEHILGHDDISPNRKVDPGPAFPLAKIKSKLGERK